MPIYEYRCRGCGEVSSLFTKTINTSVQPVCFHCRSTDLRRLMSSFAMGKTVQSVHESYPSPAGSPPLDYYNDPRNIGRHTEESYARHGLEMPESVRNTINAAREGDLPKEIDL